MRPFASFDSIAGYLGAAKKTGVCSVDIIWEQIEDYAAAVDCLAGEEVKAAYLQGAADFARVMARTESNMTD